MNNFYVGQTFEKYSGGTKNMIFPLGCFVVLHGVQELSVFYTNPANNQVGALSKEAFLSLYREVRPSFENE